MGPGNFDIFLKPYIKETLMTVWLIHVNSIYDM